MLFLLLFVSCWQINPSSIIAHPVGTVSFFRIFLLNFLTNFCNCATLCRTCAYLMYYMRCDRFCLQFIAKLSYTSYTEKLAKAHLNILLHSFIITHKYISVACGNLRKVFVYCKLYQNTEAQQSSSHTFQSLQQRKVRTYMQIRLHIKRKIRYGERKSIV